MSCIYNTPYSIDCMSEHGGIAKVVARNFSASNVYTYTAVGDISGGTATDSWYTIEQRSEQAELTSEGAFSQENGNFIFPYTLNINLDRATADVRTMIYVMAQKNLEFLVYGNNGNVYSFGSEFGGAYMNSANPGLGKALTDKAGATVGFLGKHSSPLRLVTAGFIATQTIA